MRASLAAGYSGSLGSTFPGGFASSRAKNSFIDSSAGANESCTLIEVRTLHVHMGLAQLGPLHRCVVIFGTLILTWFERALANFSGHLINWQC